MQSRQDGELNVKKLRQLLKGILDPKPQSSILKKIVFFAGK
jgi:hypothetical protein